MQYIKNMAFTKLIKANGRIREFNFRKKRSSENPLYEIDVSDEKGVRYYLSAARINNRWVLVETPVPVWIKEAAIPFHEVIEEQEPCFNGHLA